jgi:histidinol-phosphate aminotransferase
MPLSRRSFLSTFDPEGSALSTPLVARGAEAEQAGPAMKKGTAPASMPPAPPPMDPDAIHLDSNENPLGPGPAALEALTKGYDFAGRYPTNAKPSASQLRETIARKFGVRPENVVVANGSGELLRVATRVYTSPSRHLLTASPTFASPEEMAGQVGSAVKRVLVDEDGKLDLDRMAAGARWAGLIFFCNPNNPTGTVHSFKAVADFVGRVRRESPETAILIDEAYHDYVDDPNYGSAVALALEHQNVLVTRTLSKAYGMAGLRVGYAIAQARTIESLQRWVMTFTTNSIAQAAAVASLKDQDHIDRERARNTEVRQYVTRFFKDLGFKATDSHGNFVFVNIGRPSKEFKQACAKQGVIVGREFPPLEKTWARISLGTMEQMKKATAVFAQVLSPARPGVGSQTSGATATTVSK